MTLLPHSPIICALDTTDIKRAESLCTELDGHIGAIKLGLEFFTTHGERGVKQLMQHCNTPIFLDLKFHDIPNTVAKAILATAGMNPFMMTVHASGGTDMMKAAIDAAHELAAKTGTPRPMIVGVTVLTSMDEDDLQQIGVTRRMDEQVAYLAEMTQECGLDGIVCSPHEITQLRKQCGKEFVLVTPGIRPSGSANGDQKRTLTPKEAAEKGADFLVIGRPITQAQSPADTARDIAASL